MTDSKPSDKHAAAAPSADKPVVAAAPKADKPVEKAAEAPKPKPAADKPKKDEGVQLSFAEDFMLSGVAAVTSKTIAAPLERIKMVVQNQEEMIKKGTLDRKFTGIMDCTNWIVKNEGFLAFWKSNFTNCLRYFPTQALNFAFKGQIKRHFSPGKGDGYATILTKNIIGGGLAGGGSLAFVYSLDYARTRLANDLKSSKKGAAEREFTGLFDVYRKTWNSDGFAGLYRGFVISFVGIFIYRGFYFGLYDSIMPLFDPSTVGLGTRFMVGYAVTVAAGLASYPIDTIRRRMMMTSGAKAIQYKGSWDCTQYILKNEGMKSFFKGAGANILRGVAGAGVLAGFDTIVYWYVKMMYGKEGGAKISGGGG
jgi:solute carrier family 25 (adenine nucleotide translocator) protein 4/5/6/31